MGAVRHRASHRARTMQPSTLIIPLLCIGLLTTNAAAQNTNSSQGAAGQTPSGGSSSSSSPASSSPPAAGSSPASSSAGNPLLSSSASPQWDRIKASDVVPAVQQVLEEEGASLDLLEADLTRAGGNVTYERIFRPYTQIRYRLDVTYGMIDHLQGVLDSPALRAAIQATQPLRTAFELRFSQSKPIYAAAMRLRNTPALYDGLNPTQKRIVDLTVRDFRTSGVGLEPAQRAQYNALVDRLSRLATNFSNNVLDSTGAFKLLVTDSKQVEGMEATTRAVAAGKAADAGHKGATAEEGPWLLTLDYSTYSGVVQFAKDRELRRRFWLAYRNIAANGTAADNTAIINQMLAGRQELARILNFTNYGTLAMEGKMATLASANALMEELTAVARPTARREDAEMRAFARKASGNDSLQLTWWDNAFWSERMKEALFDVRQEQLRQYLALNNVKAGMWKLAERLYGVRLRPAAGKLPVWHRDVEVYEVLDTGSDAPIAYLYLDLFARPGSKQGGAWVQSLADRAAYHREASPAARAAAAIRAQGANATAGIYSAALAREQADWLAQARPQLPVAVLISNQNPPTGGRPSLMSLDDAETLFHEFGHSLQAMLTNVSEGLVAGMRNLEWDAVEAPSQMQEKWVYDRDTFNGFAKHWKTGEPVPPEMFERIKAGRTYRKGNHFSFSLMLSTTDLLLHTNYTPFGNLTPSALQQQQYAKIMPFLPNPEDRSINSFSHIFAGGYPAGYYSYLWSDVMSADAFMAFAEVGTANEPEVRRLGRLFRNTFFALGGSVPTAETFRRFRGREPKVAALITYNELSANTTRGTSGGSSGTSSSGSSGTSSSGSSKAL